MTEHAQGTEDEWNNLKEYIRSHNWTELWKDLNEDEIVECLSKVDEMISLNKSCRCRIRYSAKIGPLIPFQNSTRLLLLT